ncbi:uncharacterized protein GLRG_00946 [Colletotrichum graminicola M1.001]|uniref:Uncharacterized protein n=1 Tax=Colletotrichum graminicola (strain M1.001 / M2 / FGSC 10212) TaxID=645133 RepID=E3Q535_COLGM|nr:uncharacterized protein GLRG_00946 [Colletotrichum graminicola M1.001]EFQ25802.1 hypothetical protein GLRG_00946 [Colletotrichum graminicola M1.001]
MQIGKPNFQNKVEAQKAESIPRPKPPAANGDRGHGNLESEYDIQVLTPNLV